MAFFWAKFTFAKKSFPYCHKGLRAFSTVPVNFPFTTCLRRIGCFQLQDATPTDQTK